MKYPSAFRAAALLAALFLSSCFPGILKNANSATWSDSKYVLKFDKDFDRGMNPVDDLGISVVVAVDVSGSMDAAPAQGGRAKYVQASRALATVVEYLRGLNESQKGLLIKAAVIAFSVEVETIFPLTRLDEGAFASLERLVADPDNFKPQSNTSIGKAIERGSEVLASSGTILRSLLVITDGENTTGIDPASVLAAVYSNRNSASTKEFLVSTSSELVSFIGFDIDSGIFSPLAEKGARIASAADQKALEGVLKDILEADITKLESPGF